MTVKGRVKASGNEQITAATLDEAMLHTGFGLYNILHMLMCGMILMGVIMQSLALGYIMPAAQCDLELTLQQKGWLAAIPFSAIVLMSYFWGYLADTQGRRPVMLVSMLLSVIFSVLTSFSPNLTTFAVLQFISSIFTSGSTAVAYTYLGECNNLRHRDKMVAFGSSFVGTGTVVLPAISWLILPLDFHYPIPLLNIAYRPWRLLVVTCAMPYALGTLFLLFASESPKFLNAKERSEECLEVLKKMYSVNHRLPKDSFPVQSLINENLPHKECESSGIAAVWTSMKEQTLPLFRQPLLPWICLTCFVQFGILAATNGFYIWFPTILNSLANHEGADSTICHILDAVKTPADSGNGTMVMECDDSIHTETFERSIYIGLTFTSMYMIAGFLVHYVSKKLILIVVLVITGLCGVAAHLVPSKIGVIFFAVFQMSGACIGLMNAVAVELFPTKYRAMAVCLSMMMGRVGSMVGSNLIGVFLQINCGISFYLFGGILVLNGLFCFTLPQKKSNSKSSHEDITMGTTETEIVEPV